jgi:hypothetical protein
VLAAAAGAAAGCVTTYEDATAPADPTSPAVAAVPLTIPFGGAGADERLLADFYGGVFRRLQAAAEDRDPVQIEALLAAYDRPGLPARLAEVLRGYSAVALGLRWQQHAQANATVALPATADAAATPPPIGTPFTLQLTLPPPSHAVRLGGRGDADPCGFAVAIALDDDFVDGSSRSTHAQDFVWLPTAWESEAGAPLVLPIEIDAAAGDVVRRVVHLRVDMMPGYASIDGVRAPVQRFDLGATSLTQWPRGHEAVARAPLAALREALRRGDPAHHPHVFVAAAFVRGDEREPAMALLIEQVRFGRQDQALVAMAALRELTGADLPAADREAWLAWWQARR